MNVVNILTASGACIEETDNIYKAVLLHIIDADTLDFNANFGLGIFINLRIRLFGVSAPEIKKVKKESQEFLDGKLAIIELKKWFYENGENVVLIFCHRDLYGRVIGKVVSSTTCDYLNQYLINKNMKTLYKPWYHQEPLLRRR